MAVTSRCGEEQQQLLEGIVTYCDDRLARVWIETVKSEKEINFAYRSRHFNLGDWLLVSLTTDEAHEITPLLETRVLKIGVAQVRTEVIFGERNEKIGHGIIIQSRHFGRVAVFSPFSGIIRDRIYSVYVERIPRDQQWNEEESDTYWFVPSNQVPKLLPNGEYPMNDTQLIGPLTGVVVSKTRKSAFVWTPSLGEGICENDGNLVIGEWIEFTANLYFESHMHMNINFRIIEWTMADPILRCVPLFNNLMLVSTLFISHWPMNNLTVDWIGPITDRNHMLEKAVSSFGVGRKYEVMLKRSKKSLEEPIAAWNVHQVLDGGSRRNGIVCFVNIQKSLALVYIQDANCGTGRMLRVDLKIFEAVPALGDWFSFEIDENNQFWTVLSAMKSKKLCASYIIDCQLEVETEVILTDKISTKGHRVMYSAVLGAIADDANRLSNIIVDASQKYTVWCTAVRERIAGDPYWRITKIPMKDGAFITKSKLNTKIELVDNVSYVGIVVSECRTAYFVWTFSLDEIICYYKDGLHIGDWIQFWIRRKYGTHQNGNFFCVSKWQKIDSLYPTREKNNTAVVTIELMIPKNYNSWQPPSLPFFGEVLDRKRYFESNIDDIRGHIIEMDIKHIRTVKNNPNWDIVFVLLKGPLHGQEESIHTRAVEMNVDPKKIASTSNVSVQNANTFFTGDPSDPVNKSNIAEYSCYSDFKRRDYKNHSPTTYNEKKKEHHEDYNGRNDSQKDIAELDPVICSMKLLLMSKEVRQAIKTNCIEEYTALRQYFDLVS